jgi:hypothetical protein
MKSSHVFLYIALTGACLSASFNALADKRYKIPEEDIGPPFYTQIQPTLGPEKYFIPHTSEWAAIPFLRDTACVPPEFNLLTLYDIPGAFFCPHTVEGFAVFKNGPPPIDSAPYMHQLHAADEVPVWFAAWSEVEAAIQDDTLTITELLAMDSLLIGYAPSYKETALPGVERPQGLGNGKIEINAQGYLLDGGSFRLHVLEHGDDGVSTMRHVLIDIQ